jgi:DNA modification methylase
LVEQGTKIGDWVLDPFGGSGKILKACLELKRMCHIIDSSDVSFNSHLIPLTDF